MRLLRLSLATVLLVACSGSGSGADVTFLAADTLHLAGTGEREVETDGIALGLVAGTSRTSLFAAYPDRVVQIDDTGAVTPVLDVDPLAFGVEIAPGAAGTALTLVTTPLGDVAAVTRILWVTDGVEVLAELPGNLALVGLVDEGVIVRDTDAGGLAVIGFDGSVAGLGLTSGDAVVIPGTRTLVSNDPADGRLAASSLDTGRPVEIAGLPADAVMTQVAVSPTDSSLVTSLSTGDGESLGLWTITGAGPEAELVAEVDASHVVAGYSDDGSWIHLVTGDGSGLVAVELDTAALAPVDLPHDATPLGWSRTVLTLQSLRDTQSGG